MTDTRSTRSSNGNGDTDLPGHTKRTVNGVQAFRKVFYISDNLLENGNLLLQRFYHPAKKRVALFATHAESGTVMELMEFSEPRRSWLINQNVSSNGRLYMTSPIDSTFLAIHYLRKHCQSRAIALDSIGCVDDAAAFRLLTPYVRMETLTCIADIKQLDGTTFYKYNADKAMAWLTIKANRLAAALEVHGVHCGHSAISQNFMRSDKIVHKNDYLRVACDIIGEYLEVDLYNNLVEHLDLPTETPAIVEKNKSNSKRKSLQSVDLNDNKKLKLDEDLSDGEQPSKSEAASPNANGLEKNFKPAIVHQRIPTTKEKALAKGAKGTKSIASFFKK